jgi:flagellar hook-associated protein 2
MTSASSVGQLSSYFTNIINNILTVEKRPLTQLTAMRDTVNVTRGVYADLKSKLETLQLAARGLQKSDPLYSLEISRTATVSNQPSGYSVLTASASSDAGTGTYDISVTRLALAQRRVSAPQASVDQALGLTGHLLLGGSGTASATSAGSDFVTGVSVANISNTVKEMATGGYTVEMRDNNGTKEFRIVDSDGKAVSIADQSSTTGDFTTNWQSVTTGAFDTKRGLTLTLNATGTATGTTVQYNAKGVQVNVAATDTLKAVATKINDALQTEGREVQASVVGKQLLLSAANTGTAHTMIFTDATSGAGLGFTGVDLQAAQDASFTVSDLPFTRSDNTGLTDVISGTTINLAADSEGRSASLTVAADSKPARKQIEDFLGALNDLQTYIANETAITEGTDSSGTKKTYSRSPLTGETSVSDLRTSLFSVFMNNVSSSSGFQSLRDIGLGITDNLTFGVTDSSKLDAALAGHYMDLETVLDGAMKNVNELFDRFTGSSGYLSNAIIGLNSQIDETNQTIADKQKQLVARQNFLYNQYANLQAQLQQLSYTQQLMNSLYSASGSNYGGLNYSA